jgi:hypothetical protein
MKSGEDQTIEAEQSAAPKQVWEKPSISALPAYDSQVSNHSSSDGPINS